MKIEQEILQIIESGRNEGNLYFLPPKQLDRKTYKHVNKVLEALGGKWNRKAKAYVFESPIEEAIQNVLLTGEVISRKKELQFFESTAKVADRVCELAELRDDMTVLEPSAGGGSIIRALRRTNLKLHISYYEIDNKNFHSILDGDFGQCADFLKITPKRFDRIVMNPPFSMNGAGTQTDIEHVQHALEFLPVGGILVSVMSPAIKFRTNGKTTDFLKLLKHYRYEIIDLPDDAFKKSGTSIKTIVLKVWK